MNTKKAYCMTLCFSILGCSNREKVEELEGRLLDAIRSVATNDTDKSKRLVYEMPDGLPIYDFSLARKAWIRTAKRRLGAEK